MYYQKLSNQRSIMVKVSWLVLLCLFLFALPVYSATYYVDPQKGSDGNNGSIGSPWKTINRAKRSSGTVKPGDTVYVRQGTINYSGTNFGVTFSGSGDSGTSGNPITYKTYPGEAVTLYGDATVSGLLFFTGNVGYITIDGLALDGAIPSSSTIRGIYIAYANNIIVQNCNINTHIGYNITSGGQSTNLQVLNNTFFLNAAPLYINWADNVVVSGNIFRYTQEGLKINPHYTGESATNVTIKNNFFYQGGYGYRSESGVVQSFQNSGVLVIAQCNDGPMSGCVVSGVKIYNNIFWGNAQAGIRSQRDNVEIYNNDFYRQGYVDASKQQLDPTVVGAGHGIYVDGGLNNVIRNNIFWNNKGAGIYASHGGTYTESNNMTGDPLFINGDPESSNPYDPNNYRLSPASPAIDKGTDLSSQGVTTDFFGNARPAGGNFDIGIYEANSSPKADNIAPQIPPNLRIKQ